MAKLLSLQEVADVLGVSVKTVKREILDGRIVVTQVRAQRMVSEADLAAYLEAGRHA